MYYQRRALPAAPPGPNLCYNYPAHKLFLSLNVNTPQSL